METKELVTMSLAAVICIIIVVAVAIPIFGSVSTYQATGFQDNEPLYYLSESTTPDLVIEPGVSSVKVGTFAMNITNNQRTILAMSDDWLICGVQNSSIFVLKAGGTLDTVTTSITIDNGQVSYTNSSNVDKTIDITGNVIYASSYTEGKYTAYDSTTANLKINSDAVIWAYGNGTLTNAEATPNSVSEFFFFTGTYDDLTVSSNGTGTPSCTLATTVNDDGTITIPSTYLTSVSYTDTNGSYSLSPARTLMVVPDEYTYIADVDSTIMTIVDILPILLIVGLIVAIIGSVAFFRSR